MTPDGQRCKVRACMIDAMGGRTRQVYAWAISNRGRVFPWQGTRSPSQPYNIAPQEYFPGARGGKIRIPGGLNLWRCDTVFFKSDLAAKMSIAPSDPGAFHLHSNEKGELEQYAREMCAEVWDDEKEIWANPARRPNHYWDCETMALALAYILNVRHMPRPGEEPKPRRKKDEPRVAMSVSERLANFRR